MFKIFYFVRVRYCDELGVPAQKRLKSYAVSTIFARSIDHQDAGSMPLLCVAAHYAKQESKNW